MRKKLDEKLTKVLKFLSEENFSSATIVGTNTKVNYSLEVDASVLQSSANGSVVAPDGPYKLDNDVEFVVKGGKISEIINEGIKEEVVEPVEEVEAKEDEVKEDEVNKVVEEAIEDQIEIDLTPIEEDEIEALKGFIEALKKELEALQKETPSKEELRKFKTELDEFKTEFMNEYRAIPAQFSKTDTRVELEDENEKFARVARAFSKNN